MLSLMKRPEPPEWVYPFGNRLLGPIPSVPALQSYRDKCLAYTFLRGLEGVDEGWYTVMRDLERAEQALDDARWRLACASWRWVRESARPVGPDDDFWWICETAIAARRFLIMGLLSHYPPGKALALRTPTEVAR